MMSDMPADAGRARRASLAQRSGSDDRAGVSSASRARTADAKGSRQPRRPATTSMESDVMSKLMDMNKTPGRV
ncbi:hypothetical protein XF14_15205 [Burkholderia gladioli]|nr:hypothetical protein XF14_15205 [Burkholderia gladioli]